MNKSERKLIEQVADILDAELGDTEPYLPDGITDEEIREEQPLFWACRELNRILMRQQTIEMKQRRIKSLKAVDIGVLATGPDQEFSVQ